MLCLESFHLPTGGILQDDWVTAREDKLAIIAVAHPNPTQWPHDEVTPAAPPPEECHVEPLVEATAFGPPAGQQQASETQPTANDQPAAAAAPPAAPMPATGTVVMQIDNMTVREAQTWKEGDDSVYQFDIDVMNNTSQALQHITVLVSSEHHLVNSWNCTKGAEGHADGRWCFSCPEWVGKAGGLAPGSSIVFGVVVKGGTPSNFELQQS